MVQKLGGGGMEGGCKEANFKIFLSLCFSYFLKIKTGHKLNSYAEKEATTVIYKAEGLLLP